MQNAQKLKSLKPFKKKTVLKTRESDNKIPECRYFHCVFAYNTDFKSDDWARSEYNRFLEVSHESNTDIKKIDRIYVVNKGIINPVIGSGVNERDNKVITLMYFYSHILNFLFRENGRRHPVPYELYSGRQSQGWVKL